ncbi:MAG: acyltransferase, partial [Arachnia propionica]
WIRYLADASYWMYLVHLPLLVLFEIPLADLGWPILVKLLLTWAVTTAVLLITYELLVRHTWLGAWLNGRRYPRRAR